MTPEVQEILRRLNAMDKGEYDGRYPDTLCADAAAVIEKLSNDAQRYQWLRAQLPRAVDDWTLTRLAAGISAGDAHIDSAIGVKP